MSRFINKAGRIYREINHCLASAEVYFYVAYRGR